MDQTEGLHLMARVKEDGTLKEIEVDENTEWNLNETIHIVGAKEKEDGIIMAEVRFMIKERWNEDPLRRTQ